MAQGDSLGWTGIAVRVSGQAFKDRWAECGMPHEVKSWKKKFFQYPTQMVNPNKFCSFIAGYCFAMPV